MKLFLCDFSAILTMDPIVIYFIKLLMWFPFSRNFLLTWHIFNALEDCFLFHFSGTRETLFLFSKKLMHWKIVSFFIFLPNWTRMWFYHFVVDLTGRWLDYFLSSRFINDRVHTIPTFFTIKQSATKIQLSFCFILMSRSYTVQCLQKTFLLSRTNVGGFLHGASKFLLVHLCAQRFGKETLSLCV
jgi:hypothetical protein